MLTRDQLHAYLSAGIGETCPADELDALASGLSGEAVSARKFPDAGRRIVALAGTQPGCGFIFHADPTGAKRRQDEHAARGIVAEVVPWEADGEAVKAVVERVRSG